VLQRATAAWSVPRGASSCASQLRRHAPMATVRARCLARALVVPIHVTTTPTT
jgi:hypothetical protein